MGWWGTFKSLSVVSFLLAYIYLASGILVSFLCLCGLPLWFVNKSWYRIYISCLTTSLWSMFSFLAHWWTQSDLTLYISPEDQAFMGKEHIVCLSNHNYEMDWLMAWMMSERFGMLGNTKIYGKNVLKYVPVIGWTWYFSESIFLQRDWKKDKKILEHSIDEITSYPESIKVALLLYPEGTRCTPEKFEASIKIAKEKGYPLYKHLLLPRTRGFALSMQMMKGKIPAIMDVTTGFPSDEPEPTLMDAIRGKKFRCHMLARRYEIDKVPTETEEATGKWLRELYSRKDKDFDIYLKTGKFVGVPVANVPKRMYDLFFFIWWAVISCIPLVWYLTYVFTSGSLMHQLSLIVIVAIIVLVTKFMIGFASKKNASSYGKEKKAD